MSGNIGYRLHDPLPSDVLIGGNTVWSRYRRYPVFSWPWLTGRIAVFFACLTVVGVGVGTGNYRDGLASGGYLFVAFLLMSSLGPAAATLVRHRRWPEARERMGVVLALLAGVALAVDFRARIAVAAVTALCLVVAMRSDRVRSFAGVSPLVQLGQMSYSVFLVHFAVCLLVNAVVSHLWPTSPVLNAFGMLLAFALSLAAGRLLYLRVERHVPSWSTALRWQLGLVGAGMLVVITSNWA